MKKIIIILAGVVILTVIALLFAINILFFREISPAAGPRREETAVKEAPQMNVMIPSAEVPTTEEIANLTETAAKRREILKEREAEAARNRAINRANAMAQLKAQESNPPSPAAPIAETPLPTEEELKELEKKGIVSY